MQIKLQSVVPKPLEGTFSGASIWGKEITLNKGGRYLVSAESGKGKSTLISYIYGIRQDFSGDILLDTNSVKGLKPLAWSDIRSRQLSIVFQNLRLFPQLTAWENLMIKHRLNPVLSESEIRDLCQELEVAELRDKPVLKLSMGQQQRFALIRSLLQPFEFLLLDEPFSHLDEGNRLKMENMIERFCKANQAGLIITSLGDTGSLTYDSILKV